jgi:hypothetical protein
MIGIYCKFKSYGGSEYHVTPPHGTFSVFLHGCGFKIQEVFFGVGKKLKTDQKTRSRSVNRSMDVGPNP